jgi:Na+/phosphate symporter
MSAVKRAALAAWDFVVGDDWITAAGVGVAIAITAVIASSGAAAWWVMPLAVLVLLAQSVGRALRGG